MRNANLKAFIDRFPLLFFSLNSILIIASFFHYTDVETMFIMPYSTDVHDGKIRLAGLEIIGMCLIVQFFVSADMGGSIATLTWQLNSGSRNVWSGLQHFIRFNTDEDISNQDENPSATGADTEFGLPRDLQERLRKFRKHPLSTGWPGPLRFKLLAIFTSMLPTQDGSI